MADIIGAGAAASTSVLGTAVGTATGVIYTAAVVLSGAGIGLADTGSFTVQDQEHANGSGHAGSGGAGATEGAGATAGYSSSGDSLLGFAHANLDPHTQGSVGLVGQVLHNLGVG